MTAETWLCIDQGGQSTRAAIFDGSGELLSLGQAPLETRVHGADRVEHDPDALVDSVTTALAAAFNDYDATVHEIGGGKTGGRTGGKTGGRIARKAGAKTGRRSDNEIGNGIQGAALATQRSTLVCARRETAEALSPVISWQDRRGADALDTIAAGKAGRIHDLTGLRVSPHYGAGKLRWCLRHLGAVADAARHGELVAAPLASYLLRRLGIGRGWQVDPANASRMLLMDASTLDWSRELLQLFELENIYFPDIHPTRHDYGSLAIANRSIPLRVCTGDQSAALFCTGVPASGTVFINIGTGAFIQCSTAGPPIFDSSLLTSVVRQDASSRQYVIEGTVNGAASAVEAALVELEIPRPGQDEIDAALTGIAAAPLYLNGISGLGSPDWVADFESRFVAYADVDRDAARDATPEAASDDGSEALGRLAAVYESIVFLIMRNLDRMRRLVHLERIVMTGGLARLDWMGRQLASLSGLPVERPVDSEATLRGLYFLLRSEDGEGSASRSDADVFMPGNAQVVERRYRAWTLALDRALERERR